MDRRLKLFKEHVTEHLTELLHNTTFNEDLLVQLISQKVLGDSDAKDLKRANLNDYEKVQRLYELVGTRKGGFEVLKAALFRQNQTGAADILQQIEKAIDALETNFSNKLLYNHSKVQYEGNRGTQSVFEGTFGFWNVAVKKIILSTEPLKYQSTKVHHNILVNEIKLLSETETHENVIRYFTAEFHDKFVLLAIELCTYNLKEWVQSQENLLKSKEVIRQTAAGVLHLHKNFIVHGNLKPSNILIANTTAPKVKIADFKMAKKIHSNSSCKIPKNDLCFGKNGLKWAAPEITKAVDDKMTDHVEMSFACDMFSLGCIFYYIITNGRHPFGAKSCIRYNITNGICSITKADINTISKNCLLLILPMIKTAPQDRPLSSDVLLHHFFWPNEKKQRFLLDVSTLLNIDFRDSRQLVSQIKCFQYSNWMANISPELMQFFQRKNLGNNNLFDLINSIAILQINYESLPDTIKAVVGTFPDGISKFWFGKFQNLLPQLYLAFQSLKSHHYLKAYYSKDYNFRDDTGLLQVHEIVGHTDKDFSKLETLIHPSIIKICPDTSVLTSRQKFTAKNDAKPKSFVQVKQLVNEIERQLKLVQAEPKTIQDKRIHPSRTKVATIVQNFESKNFIFGLCSANKTTLHFCVQNTYESTRSVIQMKTKIISDFINKSPSSAHTENDMSSALFEERIHMDLIFHLLKCGLNPYSTNHKGNTILHHFASYCDPDEFHRLIAHLINEKQAKILNQFNKDGFGPLSTAIKYFEPKLETLDILSTLENFDPNERSKIHQKSILCYAVDYKRSFKFIAALIKSGADTTELDKDKCSFYHVCVKLNDANMLAHSLSHKFCSDINNTDKNGSTALHYIFSKSSSNWIEFAKMLIDAGIDVNKQERKMGKTALWLAVFGRRQWSETIKIIKYLTNKGADINIPNYARNTILHEAIYTHFSQDKIECLVQNGADANLLGNNEQTVLHTAVINKYDKIIESLVRQGVDVNAKDEDGCTALHLLFSDTNPANFPPIFSSYKILDILKKIKAIKNVDWETKNRDGDTLMDLALNFKHVIDEDVIHFIKSMSSIAN